MSNNPDKPQTADLEYVRSYVAGLKKAEWLKCREDRHAFPDRAAYRLVDPHDESVVERIKKCRRCHVKKIETLHVLDGRATRTSVEYKDHPEGYLMEPGHGRLDAEGRDVIRYENLYHDMRRYFGER